MVRVLPAAVAVVVLVSSGLIHGLWTDRWQPSAGPERAAARLERVPLVIGDWKGQPVEMDPQELKNAGIVGQLSRRYEDPRTGSVVALTLLCGRPGKIAVHTPDMCFPAAGYEMASPKVNYTVRPAPPAAPAEFWTARFHKPQVADPTHLRVFWSWSASGDWKAPEDPRLAFAGWPALYKLYVVRQLNSADDPLQDDPCLDFLRRLLPELHKALFADP
jgi:hypothetical protein